MKRRVFKALMIALWLVCLVMITVQYDWKAAIKCAITGNFYATYALLKLDEELRKGENDD